MENLSKLTCATILIQHNYNSHNHNMRSRSINTFTLFKRIRFMWWLTFYIFSPQFRKKESTNKKNKLLKRVSTMWSFSNFRFLISLWATKVPITTTYTTKKRERHQIKLNMKKHSTKHWLGSLISKAIYMHVPSLTTPHPLKQHYK
jgi:Na+/proline symporter